ncbi:MAG: hypothetical protein ABMB14_17940 [Myxococcota bacterium]
MKSEVETSTSLFDWFHGRVKDAHRVVGAELSTDSELYLASLLTDRARTDRPGLPESTLVELHARAQGASPSESARTYRELGDRSLYTVGYFEESLARSTVGPSYYCDMGAAAYLRVDQVFKRWFSNAFDGVFEELAEQFRGCARILREVRRTVDDEPDVIMRLYRQWTETGSEDAAARLRAHGLVLPPRTQEA